MSRVSKIRGQGPTERHDSCTPQSTVHLPDHPSHGFGSKYHRAPGRRVITVLAGAPAGVPLIDDIGAALRHTITRDCRRPLAALGLTG